MKAAVFREVGQPLEIEDIQISKPGPREVLVRTAAAGVCHSDLHFIEGLYPGQSPMVLGHESAGIVEQVGSDVSYVKPGDHVITCLSVFCGHCESCLTGHMSLCSSSETRRGHDEEPRLAKEGNIVHQFANLSSFAEQMLIHEHALVKIRDDMPLDRAALIGCGVTTGVGSVFHTAKVEPGSSVAVIGCGGVGLSCINGAALAGAGKIIAVDMVDSKLEMAKDFGATHVVNGSTGDVVDQVRELTGGQGVQYSFEAIGLKQTAEQAFSMIRPGGAATIIGMIPVGVKIELTGSSFLQEKKIQGSMMGSNRFRVDMPRFIDFYLQGKLHLDQMISKRLPLEKINDAFADMKTGEVARSVIIFDH
ncbi:MAG: Zn-dependent alcohol dehydrogenase [bacterium]|nr:Zn-dependent alcohol dehydrogenase [Gammaproteobacteria bacterium]HIL94472.1 Zn-dependent alcohol dehydrogenase [Pseudomonadales bacterium]